MTGSEERQLLADYVAICSRLAAGFEEIVARATATLPISADRIDALPLGEENVVLAFLKRYEQFEDALGRMLKTVSQIMALGKIERLTPRDIANKAEAFGIVDSAEVWAEAVRARNALAHEYPLRPDKRADQINRAWEHRAVLVSTWNALRDFVEREGLVV